MFNMNEKSTIQMMKLFQEQVKKDISNTNSVIKLVQEKLKDCDLNLNSLKQISKELNIDFANIENKVNSLNCTLKTTNTDSSPSPSSLSRNSSLSSLTDNLNENKLNEALSIKADNNRDDLDDYENTYIYVSIGKDGTSTEEINWTKRSSISSNNSDASKSDYLSDENSNDSEFKSLQTTNHQSLDYNQTNEMLIRMLLQGSSTLEVDK